MSKEDGPEIQQSVDSVPPQGSDQDVSINDKKLQHSGESESASVPYTVFTRRHKRILTFVLTLACIASPLTATIYLPLLPILETQYHASSQAVNLTISFYVIVQSVTPALFAPFSDTLGRRPISLLTYLIYAAASLGLALNKSNYVALLLLRGLQALGASACVSIAYGVIADVCVPSGRGGMIGPVMSATNLGTCIGPVMGELIAWRSSDGVEWIFWALAIFAVVNLLFLAGLLPETARAVVGNGSRRTKEEGFRGNWLAGIRGFIMLGIRWGDEETQKQSNVSSEQVDITVSRSESCSCRRTRGIPNPLACLKIMFWKDTCLLLCLAGVNYAVWYCIQASYPAIYQGIYGWNQLYVGLAYVPGAVGVIVGGIVNGKYMDFRYKLTAKEGGLTVDNIAGDNLDTFPIEKARTRGLLAVWIIYNASLVGFGWSVERSVHPSVPLILTSLVGCFGTFIFFSFNTLLVDVHPENPSTAAAAATMIRCGLSAAGVAALQPLSEAVGRAGTSRCWPSLWEEAKELVC